MGHAANKRQRIEQVEHILRDHPEGLTRSELARKIGVNRSTINKWLDNNDLPHVYEDDDGKLCLLKDSNLARVTLHLNEITMLHIAGRLLVRQTSQHNPYAASALRKLADVIELTDKDISQHLEKAADSTDSDQQILNETYLQVLRVLTEARARKRKVTVEYELENGEWKIYTFSPYFIEPYAPGLTTHVIGFREPPAKIRTFKLERLRNAALSMQDAVPMPADFDPEKLLEYAWGIWYTDEEPELVELKFSKRVQRRVLETRWHRKQEEPQILEDGSVIWRCLIAEPKEMEYWVRGWGSDVEVMKPERLREKIKRDARKLGELYDIALLQSAIKQYYAHTRDDKGEADWQLLKDHLIATGDIAVALGADAGVSQLARVAGLLHDIGKYSQAFQNRLHGSKQKVDHATAGAREVMALFPNPPHRDFAELLSYCIAGHHSGLPDYGSMGDIETDGTLLARREKKKLEDYSAYKSEIEVTALEFQQRRIKPSRFRFAEREQCYPGFSTSFLTRMIFSTLVDADWLETERFALGEVEQRGQYASMVELAHEFEQYMQRFANPQSDINRKRTETLHACLTKVNLKPGFFTLTVPTGGAKTLISMAFALQHAVANGLNRIIYVIPFTSIIEQNAAVFRGALGPLGPENVLEHHSNLDWEQLRQNSDHDGDNLHEKLKLAAENWDIPIVVTTNVQFFESLFASKKSRSRKLHNIAKSIVIFDEVQMLPRDFLKPCLLAMSELVQNYGASVVLSTATQPALQDFFPASTNFTELAPDPVSLFNFYRRVQIKPLGKLTDAVLLERLNAHQQVLCIVNTRRHAKGLFDSLKGDGNFHLSTLMCPTHRKAILEEIRMRLEQNLPCRVISTQVIEAGIDVDFPVGYRAMAGLDSIIQAAGRVNREGGRPSGDMFVFYPDTEFIKRTPTYIEQTAAVAQSTLREFADDPTDILAIQSYYRSLYVLQNEKAFDTREILKCFDKGTGRLDFDFKTAAENFKLIDENTVAILIPYNSKAKQYLETLKYTAYPIATLRKLQPFAVNVYEREFLALQSIGAIQTIHEHYHTLDEQWMQTYYHLQTGLVLPDSTGGAAVFFD